MSLKISFRCPHCNKINNGLLGIWDTFLSDIPENENILLLKLNSCQSAGLYGAYVECLKCGEDIDLME